MYFAQHGDVLLKSAEIPKTAKTIRSLALVSSKVTGHTHRVTGAVVLKDGETLYVRSAKAFKVSHEEHKTLTIPKGTYRVDHVQEYDHLTEEARRVVD